MNDFITSISGGYSLGMWLAFLFFAVLGAIAFSWMEVDNRDQKSPKTPRKFSFRFLFRDNARRYLVTAILIYVQFRFFKEINGQPLTEYVCFLIGFGADGIAAFGKKNTKVLKADREKLLNYGMD